MRRIAIIVLFVFSLALNVAVAVTLGWHMWMERNSSLTLQSAGSALTNEDFSKMRKMVPADMRRRMMEMQRACFAKRLEVLTAIASAPEDSGTAEQRIVELQALRVKADQEAFERIRNVMASLPAEKRQEFLEFLKNRCCMGPGMGPGMGRGMGGRMRGGPGGCSPCPVQVQEN
jgi:uncharacterized membrane protein